MKKTFLFLLSFILLGGVSFAQTLPPGAQLSLNVINVSQGNTEATQVGAQAGDVLRYELNLVSATADITDYITSVDIAEILQSADIVNTGLGEQVGSSIAYPAFSKQAPCDHTFAFFVRVKEDCGGLNQVTMSWEGNQATVSMKCGLSQTGPALEAIGLIGLILSFLLGFTFLVARKRRQPPV